jgi:1-acyl-sn-glycerol-3-phosphate acyltransferase
MVIRRPIFILSSYEHFRNPFVRRFKWAEGMIPIGRRKDNLRAIRQMILVLRSGYPVGIFPEGGMNWDGKTLPVLLAVSKLIKVLKAPVVPVVIKGGYLAFPRWTKKRLMWK